jgi:hypothetical protein
VARKEGRERSRGRGFSSYFFLGRRGDIVKRVCVEYRWVLCGDGYFDYFFGYKYNDNNVCVEKKE